MSSRQYLVTGGSGFLGSALVRGLLSQGHKIRVLDDNSRGRMRRLEGVVDDIDFREGDIRDPGTVARAIAGVDCVCHLAFVNGTRFFYEKPELVLEVGVKGMMNVLDGCREHGVRDLVVASSSEVYQTPPAIPTDETVPLSVPDPLNPRYSYGGGKIISELLTLNYGRRHFDRAVIFRPHNVYGPDMGGEHVLPQFVLRMKRLAEAAEGPIRFPIQGSGEETRAFIYVDDFTDGLLRVIEHGEHLGIYHIGTDEEISIRAAATEVANWLKRDILIEPGQAAAGGTPRRCPDITRLRALGFEPAVPFREGVAKLAEWYAAHADEFPIENDDLKKAN